MSADAGKAEIGGQDGHGRFLLRPTPRLHVADGEKGRVREGRRSPAGLPGDQQGTPPKDVCAEGRSPGLRFTVSGPVFPAPKHQ
jgi:hypothetical protein